MSLSVWRVSVLCLAGSLLCGGRSIDAATYAVVVGVNRYEEGQLSALKYSANDATQLWKLFEDAQFDEATLLTDAAGILWEQQVPSRVNILRQIRAAAQKCEQGDALIVALSGHGVQYKESPLGYFCPADADLQRPETLISHDELHQILEASEASSKLLFLDACRNEILTGTRAPTIELEPAVGGVRTPPAGVAAFYSCAATEHAFEHKSLKHGVFFHFLITGLQGTADLDRDGKVDLPELEKHLKTQTPRFTREQFGTAQTPELHNQSRGLIEILAWKPERTTGEISAVFEERARSEYVKETGRERSCLTIAFLSPASRARRAGLRAGDILTALDGQPVATYSELVKLLRTYEAGEQVRLAIIREGKTLSLSCQLDPELSYDLWLDVLRKAAKAGNASAIYTLANEQLSMGEIEADEFLRKLNSAARAGQADAQVELANLLRAGTLVVKDELKAIRWYRKAAEQGHSWAEFYLGDVYAEGDGVRQDEAEALRWFRKSAEQADADAQNMLGLCYQEGRGLAADAQQAVAWYRKAADQEYAWGQYNLGTMYANGIGLEQDDVEAVRWFRAAAEQELADAQVALGEMYDMGRGVPQDDPQALAWFRRAADQNHAWGQYYVGQMFAQGRGVTQDDAEAVRWFRKGAEQEDADSQQMLGLMYSEGRGVPQDDVEAVAWYRKAAAQNSLSGLFSLGVMYHDGRGVEQDDDEALRYYRQVAEQNDPDGQNMVGRMYEEGEGVDQDYRQALDWYRKAADQDHALGQYNLGRMYADGLGVEQDHTEALRWYRTAAEQGEPNAQNSLGRLHEDGVSVPQDEGQAVAWFRKAAEQDHAWSQHNLARMYAEGLGVEQDRLEADRWFQKAAIHGGLELRNARKVFDARERMGVLLIRNDCRAARFCRIRFQLVDGSWQDWVNLKMEKYGDQSWAFQSSSSRVELQFDEIPGDDKYTAKSLTFDVKTVPTAEAIQPEQIPSQFMFFEKENRLHATRIDQVAEKAALLSTGVVTLVNKTSGTINYGLHFVNHKGDWEPWQSFQVGANKYRYHFRPGVKKFEVRFDNIAADDQVTYKHQQLAFNRVDGSTEVKSEHGRRYEFRWNDQLLTLLAAD